MVEGKEIGYEIFKEELAQLYSAVLIFENTAVSNDLSAGDIAASLLKGSSDGLLEKRNKFFKENTHTVYHLRAEMLRLGLEMHPGINLSEPVGDLHLFALDVQDWSRDIALTGLYGLIESNSVSTPLGKRSFPENYIPQIMPMLAKLYKYRFADPLHVLDVAKEKVSMKTDQEYYEFASSGTYNFSNALAASVDIIRKFDVSVEEKRQSIIRLARKDNLIGQLMRIGGRNANDFDSKFISKEWNGFKNFPPIIVNHNTGDIYLDSERISEFYTDVEVNSITRNVQSGRPVCIAAHSMFDPDSSDSIIHRMVEQIAHKIPDSFLVLRRQFV